MSFWAACFYFYGPTGFFLVGAAWLFTLGVKDLTFARVRLTSLDDPQKRGRAVIRSIAAEAALLVLRVGTMLAIASLLRPFNATVSALVLGLSVCALFWTRETSLSLMRAYQLRGLYAYVSLASAAAGLATIAFLAARGAPPTEAAVGALVLREGIAFGGALLAALAGRLGLRLRQGQMLDEEEGTQFYSVTGSGGREVRTPWKLLIAENVVWSRWRLLQFVTRFAASGVLGPIGGFGTRLFFTYRPPGAYKHSERISAKKVILVAGASSVTLLVLIGVAERFGLLHALGITVAGFLFRLASHASNALFWRQLTPLVSVEAKFRIRRPRAS